MMSEIARRAAEAARRAHLERLASVRTCRVACTPKPNELDRPYWQVFAQNAAGEEVLVFDWGSRANGGADGDGMYLSKEAAKAAARRLLPPGALWEGTNCRLDGGFVNDDGSVSRPVPGRPGFYERER